jgi:glucose/arabinose dehydrogenase
MRLRTPLRRLCCALLVAALLPAAAPANAAVPAGFEDQDFLLNIAGPTAMAFLPDGRALVAQKSGLVRVVKDGALLPDAALDITAATCDDGERGLLGIAADPQFATNGYFYVYYTHIKDPPAADPCSRVAAGSRAFSDSAFNRVSRFKLAGDAVDASVPEQALIDRVPSFNTNHNAGDIHFGRDGYLYVSIGDGGADYRDGGGGGNNDAARQESTLLGKILRITADGGIPPGNPFVGADSDRCALTGRTLTAARCQETFAWGLRNPFRIAFDPNSAGTRFFINDVGQNLWEEIDEAASGADFGWNVREGFCANGASTGCRSAPGAVVNGQTDPVHAYGRDVGFSITGGAFVPSGAWPLDYDGDYFFADFNGKLFRLEASGGSYTRTEFATGLSGPTTLLFGPAPDGRQALYYMEFNGGRIGRIVATASANRSPNGAMQASPTSGALPLEVTFTSAGSADPDGDALSYTWDFGDGSPPDTTSGATVLHTYTALGIYTATLTVRDNRGAADPTPATVQISAGNARPVPQIDAPAPDFRYAAGQEVTLQGSAIDPEEGALPGERLSWQAILHHASHTHPLREGTGATLTFTAPPPEDLAATQNSYIEVRLSATDAAGATSAEPAVLELRPRLVNVTFVTEPANLDLIVNGVELTRTTTLVSWEGYGLQVVAPTQPDGKGGWLRLVSWSNGGGPSQTIVTPAQATTYTATFGKAYVRLFPFVRR